MDKLHRQWFFFKRFKMSLFGRIVSSDKSSICCLQQMKYNCHTENLVLKFQKSLKIKRKTTNKNKNQVIFFLFVYLLLLPIVTVRLYMNMLCSSKRFIIFAYCHLKVLILLLQKIPSYFSYSIKCFLKL